ncbi:Maf family protein [Paraglaciecola aestuariivivens]
MLILASQSPRRAELLKQLGVDFIQQAVNLDESLMPNESAQDYVWRLAEQKAALGFTQQSTVACVLGADTIVVANQQILGKPKDKLDFAATMRTLSDSSHQVFTAVSLINQSQQKTLLVETKVHFGPLTKQQIEHYWQTGEPQDKAGGYGIQGIGGKFVKQIEGSYSAVVGLPLYQTNQLLTEFGLINEC